MTLEEGKRIFSNEYADLLIHYYGNTAMLENFKDATIQIIDYFFAVVYVPVEQVTNKTIMELGYSSMPSLSGIVSSSSMDASNITKLRNFPAFNLRGEGVLIGILDTGIDYTNPIFRKADNTSKIISIWDQTIYTDDFKSNTYYGTEYTQEQINAALQNENPFSIVPSTDEIGHGTMIAGIIAGNDVPESNFYGVVPDAELVVVKLKPAKPYLKEFWRIPETAVCYQANDIMFALEYLEQVAIRLNRPMSICVALGSSLGPHDERADLNDILSKRAENMNFSIAIAAGNEGNAKRHYSGNILSNVGFDSVEMTVGENESGFTLELWGDSPGLFSIDIISPSGETVPRIFPTLRENKVINFLFEETEIIVDYQLVESQTGDELILMRFKKPAPGIWIFNVYGMGTSKLHFNMWLPMESFITNNTYFLQPDPDTTIISLGNSTVPITVTAYNSVDESIYQKAGRGYTRTGRFKPDIAAPGVSVISPALNHGFTEVTGTSPATAHAAGVAAMILEWAIVERNLTTINTIDIKILMIRGARRLPGSSYPNKQWGYGILDVYNIFDSLRRG
ncbi:S8 family peptidase [Anaeromicropila populeti]|uniref:Subtilase family protein n=1 Tax=Anaeromicropila populeti TaxID=37658 RepID=A0A1I6HY31_9FIRM|nr:S8 family peptidase [Anaeromicropila populeti]SFR59337.1 Subtilase family protein [Anaeromicropila populeti]